LENKKNWGRKKKDSRSEMSSKKETGRNLECTGKKEIGGKVSIMGEVGLNYLPSEKGGNFRPRKKKDEKREENPWIKRKTDKGETPTNFEA